MPAIVPNQKFIHEGKVYEADTSYEVSEGEAYYFAKAGWTGPKGGPTGETVTLDIQDVRVQPGSEVV